MIWISLLFYIYYFIRALSFKMIRIVKKMRLGDFVFIIKATEMNGNVKKRKILKVKRIYTQRSTY